MKIKIVPMAKKDVEKLSDDQLSVLIEWGESDGFSLAQNLCDDFITRRTKSEMEQIEGSPFEEIGKRMAALAQVKIGIDFFLDAVQRAREEVKDREAKAK